MYALAAYLGLRRGEIAQLDGGDIDHAAGTLTVRASVRKNRKLARLPIHDAALGRLADLPRTGPLIPGFGRHRTTDYLRPDLDAAGIARTTAAGIIDLHSLRASLATNLARAGVPLAMARELMRHASVELTAKAYTKLEGGDLSAAAGRLAGLVTTDVAAVAPPADGKGGRGIAADNGKASRNGRKAARPAARKASKKTGRTGRRKAGDSA